MIYKERVNSKLTNVYEVSFDKEKLQEIFKELEKYEYIKYFNGFFGGQLINSIFPESIKRKKAICFLNKYNKSKNFNVLEDSLKFNKNNIEYIASYSTQTDLYKYIDIILNNKRAIDYTELFNGYNYLITEINKEEIIIKKLLSYVNSIELIPYSKREFNHSSDKKIIELEEQSNPYYDFDGLLKLYYKTLKCLNFKLQTQIVEVDEEIYTNGMNLIKK